MKLTAFLLFVCCLQVSANGFAQGKITIRKMNASLEEILLEINKQTGVLYSANNETLKKAKRMDINVKDADLVKVLGIVFEGQPLTYSLRDNIIIVKEKPASVKYTIVDERTPIDVKGKVTDEKGNPIAGVTVTIKGTNKQTLTDENGEFSMSSIDKEAVLVFTSVNMEAFEIKVNGQADLIVKLKTKVREMTEVVVSTGYQTLPKERATGSFVKVDNELLNRRVSSNILNRLEGVASGVLFNSNTSDLGFSIRGRSTIFANTSPLIVLDNFPYDGDLNTINPNDVENITILKDAAASSIWGVRAANGVVVISTKKGKYNQGLRVSLNSNVTVVEEPDLYGKPDITTGDLIDIETFLFDKNVFNSQLSFQAFYPYIYISPIIDVLDKKKKGTLSPADADTQIEQLKAVNNKDDLLKYYYRKGVIQQYSINLSGGGNNNKYYVSFGYDKNLQNQISNLNDRFTINASNIYSMLKGKLEFTTGINFSTSKAETNVGESYLFGTRPYIRFADDNGYSLPVFMYGKQWTDTVGNGKLLDWHLYPLDEVKRADSKNKLINYNLNVGIKYQILKCLDLNVLYQYNKGSQQNDILRTQQSFYTRDLINQFSQINYSTGNVTRPIPVGDILDINNNAYYSNNFRSQLSYSDSWRKHSLIAIGGIEVKDYNYNYNSNRLYGYNEDIGTISNVDYVSLYPTNQSFGSNIKIPANLSIGYIADHYISYYSNASYTFNKRYVLTASIRRDESNLFGVKANQKGVPLWSFGGSWNISNETFYHLYWMPELKIRLTNGYNGNVDKTVSAYTTAQAYINNPFSAPTSQIINPPNPSLSWEKVNMTNFGIDFSLFNNRINGSFEYYLKKGKDIIGFSPLAPQTGMIQYKGNTADIKGKGFDIIFNSINLSKDFEWRTTFLLSYNTNKIKTYKAKPVPLGLHEGYSYNAIFSYRWGGLESSTGDPQGYKDEQASKSYGTIINTDSIGMNIVYHGSGVPTYFGSIRNTFSWKNISLSFNVIYKLAYYFRAPSINYFNLFNGFNSYYGIAGMTGAHKDFQQRWQKPGDEEFTSVPSMIYPADLNRDFFYSNSEVLVERGDQIRLQDLQIEYNLNKRRVSTLQIQNFKIYIYCNNLGTIWTANKRDIDPDYLDLPQQKTYAIGLKLDF